MKIFESPQKDLEKNLSFIQEKLLVIQKQLRALRDDNTELKTKITKLQTIMTAQPDGEEEYPTEELEAR